MDAAPLINKPPRRFRFTAEFVVPESPFEDAFWESFIRANLTCSFELAKLGKSGECVLIPNIRLDQ